MSYPTLDDQTAARLAIRPSSRPHHLLTEVGWAGEAPTPAAVPSVLGHVFRLTSWGLVPDLAAAAAGRWDFSFNAIGFRFPEGLEADELAFEGVLVWDYFGKVVLSAAAFDRLCDQAFDALAAYAATRTPEVLSQPWWPAFRAAAAVVKGRVGGA